VSHKVEDALVRELAAQLRAKGYTKVWTHRKPSSSSRFTSAIKARLGYVPILQPEIDLCMRLDDGRLVAVEAKLFKGTGPTFATPFYQGIGQALALHRYGFDHCALWFLFEDGAQELATNRYGAEAWAFVRNDLCLPLDFTYLAVERVGSGNAFNVIQYTDRQAGFSLGPIDAPTFLLTWKHSNPIRHSPVQRALRETLDEWL
jgi:hypothetical protein